MLKRAVFLVLVFVCMTSLPLHAQYSFKLTVAEAGERAVQCSADIQSALKDLDLQYKALGFTIRNFLPGIALGFGNNEIINLTDADTRLMSIAVTVTQPLWDGGSALLARAKRKRELDQSLKNLRMKADEIRERAVHLAYTILILEKKLLLKQATYKLALEQLAVMEEEARLGLIRDMDLQKGQFKTEELKLDVRNTELEFMLSRLELKKMLRLTVDFTLLDEIPHEYSAVNILVEKLYSKAVEQSGEIQDFMRQIKDLKDTLQLMRLSFLPAVSLVGSFETSTDTLPFSRYSWSIGLKINFSSGLFSFASHAKYGGTSDNSSASMMSEGDAVPLSDPAVILDPVFYENSVKRLVLFVEEKKKELKATIEELTQRYKINVERLEIAVSAAMLVKKEYELALKQKQVGVIKEIDVMNISLAMLEKETAVLDARFELIKTERELEKLANIPPGSLRMFLGGTNA